MNYATKNEMQKFTFNFIARKLEYIKKTWDQVEECIESITHLEFGNEQVNYKLPYLPNLTVFPKLIQISLQYCSNLRCLPIVSNIKYIRQWENQKIPQLYLGNNEQEVVMLTNLYKPKTIILGPKYNLQLLNCLQNGGCSYENLEEIILTCSDIDYLMMFIQRTSIPEKIKLIIKDKSVQLKPTQLDIFQSNGVTVEYQ